MTRLRDETATASRRRRSPHRGIQVAGACPRSAESTHIGTFCAPRVTTSPARSGACTRPPSERRSKRADRRRRQRLRDLRAGVGIPRDDGTRLAGCRGMRKTPIFCVSALLASRRSGRWCSPTPTSEARPLPGRRLHLGRAPHRAVADFPGCALRRDEPRNRGAPQPLFSGQHRRHRASRSERLVQEVEQPHGPRGVFEPPELPLPPTRAGERSTSAPSNSSTGSPRSSAERHGACCGG